MERISELSAELVYFLPNYHLSWVFDIQIRGGTWRDGGQSAPHPPTDPGKAKNRGSRKTRGPSYQYRHSSIPQSANTSDTLGKWMVFRRPPVYHLIIQEFKWCTGRTEAFMWCVNFKMAALIIIGTRQHKGPYLASFIFLLNHLW